jgi:hypothetical protein
VVQNNLVPGDRLLYRQAVLLVLSVSFFSVASPIRADDWTTVGNEQGLEIYRRTVPGSDIVATKGVDNHIGLPFIMKDRDFVSQVSIEVDSDQRGTHHVRGQILSGTFRARSLEQGRRAELTAEVQCDPKGSIPTWIVNLFPEELAP